MSWARQLQHDRRLIAAVLVLCALFTRLLVPTGYMLATDPASGMAVFELCPAQGALPTGAGMDAHIMAGMTMAGDMAMSHGGMDHGAGEHGAHGGGHPAGDHGSSDHPCPFAGAGAAVDLIAIVHPAIAMAAAFLLPGTPLRFSRPGLGLAAPPPPKTGPPTFR